MKKLRKTIIGDNLKKLFEENPEYSVAHLLRAVLRRKNFGKVPRELGDFIFEANDESFNNAVEKTIYELEQDR